MLILRRFGASVHYFENLIKCHAKPIRLGLPIYHAGWELLDNQWQIFPRRLRRLVPRAVKIQVILQIQIVLEFREPGQRRLVVILGQAVGVVGILLILLRLLKLLQLDVDQVIDIFLLIYRSVIFIKGLNPTIFGGIYLRIILRS